MYRIILRLFCLFCVVSIPWAPRVCPSLAEEWIPPADLVAEAISPTEVRLTWVDQATDETGYRIHRSLDGGLSWQAAALYAPADLESWTDTDLSPCTHYTYRVLAIYDATFLSEESNWASATTVSELHSGVETLWEESFEGGAIPAYWQNPGGWLVNTLSGAAYDGRYKAMMSASGGGELRSKPIDCAGASELTVSFWALSSVFGTSTSYYRLSVQGAGDPVLLDPYIYTDGAWEKRTHTISDPALLTSDTVIVWDARREGTEQAHLDLVTVTRSVDVATPTTIIRQPADVTLCSGTTAAFEVEAGGDDLTYHWRRKIGSSWADVPGADGPRLELTDLSPTDSGQQVQAVVTGACGTAYSYPATLTIESGGTITSHPSPQTVCAGESALFSVVAEGEDLGYRWQRDGVDLTDSVRLLGSDSAQLSISGVEPEDAGTYRCRVGSGDCAVFSEGADLTVGSPPTILTEPQDQTACPGEDVTLSVDAEGSDLAYQWQFKGVDLPSEETPALTISAVGSEHAGGYACVISGSCGTSTTRTASLTIGSAPRIVGEPQATVVDEGQGATFSVVAEGTALTYQWETSTDGGLAYSAIADATDPTFTTPTLGVADDGRLYRCVVQGECGSVSSLPATATVLRTQEIPLEAGWNILSLSVLPLDNAISELLGDLDDSPRAYAWREGVWRLYDPAQPESSTFTHLAPGEGFWVEVSAPATLRVKGRVPAQTEITLRSGWTLAGYPGESSRALPGALATGAEQSALIYGYEAGETWRHYDRVAEPWASTLDALVPGRGYWIHTGEETVWTVDY